MQRAGQGNSFPRRVQAVFRRTECYRHIPGGNPGVCRIRRPAGFFRSGSQNAFCLFIQQRQIPFRFLQPPVIILAGTLPGGGIVQRKEEEIPAENQIPAHCRQPVPFFRQTQKFLRPAFFQPHKTDLYNAQFFQQQAGRQFRISGERFRYALQGKSRCRQHPGSGFLRRNVIPRGKHGETYGQGKNGTERGQARRKRHHSPPSSPSIGRFFHLAFR